MSQNIYMKRYIYAAVILPVLLAGCDKGLLNQTPKTQLTTASALVTYANFQSYAWDLYDYFTGYSGNSSTTYPAPLFTQDCNSDNMAETVIGDQSQYIADTKIVPETGSATASLAISGWDFSYVRQVNVMLDAIDNSQLAAADKTHWRSVGYFFRALRYYDLIAAFGDVPWIEHTLNEDSTADLYGPRTSRDTVAQNILNDLEYADANIGTGSPDGANTINQACVDALISRFGLFEGTYRKYHGLDNANIYLQACTTYSQKLLTEYPSCMSSYDAVYNSTDLTGQAGIILFKQYSASLEDDHEFGPRFMGSTSENLDMTKDAVESYLCTDGKPISTSAVYAGNSTMFNEFRHRDQRLYFTVVPPYTVVVGSPNSTWSYTSNPADSEYIHIMDSLGKVLPVVQWSQNMNTGTVISESPHFYLYNNGQSQAISQLGYFYWKQYNRLPLDANTYSITACPLFRIEEVWLNYAEAMFEQGSFSQAIADETINKLRPRAGLPSMEIAGINASFDTNRDPDVDPVLWEIRRERRVELMGDGFRFNDIKRWDKGTYLNTLQLGVYVNNANYGNKLSIYGGGQSGYVQFFPAPVGWQPQYYLEPIPTQELQLNKALVQNPEW
jgi:hypothetical protein